MKQLKIALEKRSSFLPEDCECFRWVDGKVDGFEGISIDVYGSSLWIESTAPLEEVVLSFLKSSYKQAFLKINPKGSAPKVQELFSGSIESKIKVKEGPLHFEVDFSAGLHPGLFLDQRLNRRKVFENSRDKELLNLFCYTGSFSVAGLAGGASSVESVDLSQSYLNWLDRNISLNSLDSQKHRWIREDCRKYLKRLRKRGRRFDGVILDPPSFSQNKKGKAMSLESDFPELLLDCFEVLAKGGWILASSNLRRWTTKDFDRLIRNTLPRSARLERLPKAPDFCGDSHLNAMWITRL